MSYILYPTSHILYPASYTLHPTSLSYILYITSYILYPTYYILFQAETSYDSVLDFSNKTRKKVIVEDLSVDGRIIVNWTWQVQD
jgi:hypothetical protein